MILITGLLMGPVFCLMMGGHRSRAELSLEASLPPRSAWAVLGVQAQDPSSLGACRLLDPNGQTVQELHDQVEQTKGVSDQGTRGDAVRGTQGEQAIRFLVERPVGGRWRVQCDGEGRGAALLVHWAPVKPRITFLSPEWDTGGASVDIVVQVDDPDSTPEIVLYRDDDGEGFDGEALTKPVRPVEGRVVWRWDLTKARRGIHHLYAVAYDGSDTVARVYAPGRVFARVAADLSVTADFLSLGEDEPVLRLRVENLGPASARDVVLSWEWPTDVLQPVSPIQGWVDQGGDRARVSFKELGPGEHREVLWPFRPETDGPWSFVIAARGTGWDPTWLNNTVKLDFDREEWVFKQLKVIRGYVPDRVPTGFLLDYTVTVHNPTDRPVMKLVITERIPDETVVVDARADRGVVQRNTDELHWRISELAPHEEGRLAVSLSVVGRGEMALQTRLMREGETAQNVLYFKREIEIAPH